MLRCCLFLLLLLVLKTNAQQPAYFIFGEEQFRGVQIYDVTQDNKFNYLFATNEGLYYYDFHQFHKMDIPDSKSSSVFNFIKGKSGEIYCHNLNGQVFVIRELTCKLFYELKEDEVHSDINMICDKNNRLIVSGKKIVVLNPNGSVYKRISTIECFMGSFFELSSGEILYTISCSDSVYYIKDYTIQGKKIKIDKKETDDFLFKFFKMGGKTYAFKPLVKQQFEFNEKNCQFTSIAGNSSFLRGIAIRQYNTPGKLWVTGTLPGIHLIPENDYSKETPLLFPSYRISDVYYDHEGNILLSTFDKGIILIPDLVIPDVINSFSDDPVNSIAFDSLCGIMMGTSLGKFFYQQGNNSHYIGNKSNHSIDEIYSSPDYPFVFFYDGTCEAISKQDKKIHYQYRYALKDVAFAGNDTAFLATSAGILIHDEASRKVNLIAELPFRTYCLEYDPKQKILYASTVKGLYAINSKLNYKKITLNGKDIFPTELKTHNDKIYAASRDNSIYLIDKEAIIDSLFFRPGEVNTGIKKICSFKNTLIVNTTNGLFQVDSAFTILRSFRSFFVHSGGKVNNFCIERDTLWVSHSGGVQKINLLNPNNLYSSPEIRIDAIYVNDKLIPSFENYEFNADQRSFSFSFSSPSIRNASGLRFFYRLNGYKKEWTETSNNNMIAYNALEPGEYTFETYAMLDNVHSVVKSYSFRIDKPITSKWWFILLLIIAFVLIVFIFYRRQIKIQKNKSRQLNELNASKLTAIQSQMNPHFIFNSLNSIQDLILKSDVENSYTYIATFSDLVRKTLKYSEYDFIDFEKEIELLKIYLSLEKLRFKKDFEYQIETGAIEDIKLPPLLIQPFIENSLLHGLLHKEGKKQLLVNFELTDECLVCTITDNGIGRKRSREIKERQKKAHDSFSGKAIKKRFDILSDIYKGTYSYVYEDLLNSQGHPAGTKVVLTIPIKRNY